MGTASIALLSFPAKPTPESGDCPKLSHGDRSDLSKNSSNNHSPQRPLHSVTRNDQTQSKPPLSPIPQQPMTYTEQPHQPAGDGEAAGGCSIKINVKVTFIYNVLYCISYTHSS